MKGRPEGLDTLFDPCVSPARRDELGFVVGFDRCRIDIGGDLGRPTASAIPSGMARPGMARVAVPLRFRHDGHRAAGTD